MPHPGAHLSLFDTIEGFRHQVMATELPTAARAARLTRSVRRTRFRIAERWPWADHQVAAFTRLAALPRPLC